MTPLGVAARQYAARGFKVFPLAPRSKVPLFRQAHPAGSPERASCKGTCGMDGHGVLDATDDIDRVTRWWAPASFANIGAAVPPGVVVIDVDPRHGGDVSLARLIATYGALPETLQARSGGRDGGRHLWFRHPGGKLSTAGRPELAGLDLRVAGNYVVVEPSVHPDGGTYRWVDPAVPVAAAPGWLVDALRPPVVIYRPKRGSPVVGGESVADWFTDSTTWFDVLCPHGWHALDPDGTRWKHPAATSNLSATVTNDVLFVFSTSTPFEPTSGGGPHGYTRFRAWAVLEHAGDLSAAARAARRLRHEGKAA